MGKYDLPYTSMAEAIADAFRKVGGPDKAIVMLRRGFYNTRYHDETNKSNKAILKAVKQDAALLAELTDAKTESQLGRRPIVGDPRLVKDVKKA